MEHVVFYIGANGAPAFQRANSLEDAVSYVETLRNSQNVTEFSVHALTLVPVSLRAYYHVEVPASDDDAPSADRDVVEQAVQFALGDVTSAVVDDEPAPVSAAASAVIRPPASEPVVASEPVEPVTAPVEPVEAVAVSSEILSAAAAMAANLTTAPAEPVDLPDDDRSAEWVAAASVLEPAAVLPVTSPEAAPAEAVEPAPDAVVEPVAIAPSTQGPLPPSLQLTPFAVAPPVGSAVVPEQIAASVAPPVEAAYDEPAAPADLSGDILPPVDPTVPSGRRTLGFFAR
jgi:hypothetical protein